MGACSDKQSANSTSRAQARDFTVREGQIRHRASDHPNKTSAAIIQKDKEIGEYFQRIDTDMNQMIDYDEFKVWMLQLNQKARIHRDMSDNCMRKIFNDFDANHNGTISKNEFKGYVHKII